MPQCEEENIASAYVHVEQTLAIIKPDAIDKANEIEESILKEGFSILQVQYFVYLYFTFVFYPFLSVYTFLA